MAAQLQSISIDAPGFFGLNTQDSPTTLSEQFASVANNCVIDRSGRVAARKGYVYLDDTLGRVVSLGEFIKPDGNNEVVSVSSVGIFATLAGTTTNITPLGYNVGDGDFQQATLQQYHYLFKEGFEPIFYDGATMGTVNGSIHANGTAPKAGIVISAYGRLFVARTDLEKTTVYWSDTLLGKHWNGGTSGSINVATAWAGGADEITGLAAHNNFLIVFGSTQILVFEGANGDPNNDLTLVDTVVGVGCVAKDSIQKIGTDLLFLSDTGVRSFNRTIQEKSMPLRDVSKNVRTDLVNTVMSNSTGLIKSGYNPLDAFYIISFVGSNEAYVFDTRQPLEDGAFRATKWLRTPSAYLTTQVDKEFLLGEELGLASYEGYLDNDEIYSLSYFTNYTDFGSPNNLKFLKKVFGTFESSSNSLLTFSYDYDYEGNFRRRLVNLTDQVISEFGTAEYGIGRFSTGVAISRPSVKPSGSGEVVQFGIDAEIKGAAFSIQRLTAQATLGRSI